MKKLLALIVARNKEFYRDRGTMIWTLVFPFVVLLGFTYGISGRQEPLLRIATVPASAASQPLMMTLKETPGLSVLPTDDEKSAIRRVERYEADLVIIASPDGHKFEYAFNADADKGKLARQFFLDALARQTDKPAVEQRMITGRHIRYADWVLPGLLAMNIMFGSMFGVGYVIVRYRKNGVLKRLRATPLSALQFLVAQVVSRMLLMEVTSFIVVLGAMLLVGFRPQGSWLDLAGVLAVSSSAMISVGMLVAAQVSSEELAEGLLNLMTWPMMFLSGVWFSLEGASKWVTFTAKLMPLTHVVDGLRAVLIDGATFAQIIPQMTILLVLSVVFIAIGSAVFRWR